MEKDKIHKLITELTLLHEVLNDSLKWREVEDGIGCAQAYISNIMSQKFLELEEMF